MAAINKVSSNQVTCGMKESVNHTKPKYRIFHYFYVDLLHLVLRFFHSLCFQFNLLFRWPVCVRVCARVSLSLLKCGFHLYFIYILKYTYIRKQTYSHMHPQYV